MAWRARSRHWIRGIVSLSAYGSNGVGVETAHIAPLTGVRQLYSRPCTSGHWPRASVGATLGGNVHGPGDAPIGAFPIPLERQVLLASGRGRSMPALFGPSASDLQHLRSIVRALGTPSVPGLSAALSW